MANPQNIVKQNIDGAFFVDRTCISCSNCRDLAPQNFREAGDFFAVFNQPENNAQTAQSLDALVCCPVGAIGIKSENKNQFDLKKAIESLPKEIPSSHGKVFYLGFNSPDSYGGKAYFIKSESGNWMVESPKFTRHLVEWIRLQGGLDYIFLSHRDDVAQASEYAKEFGAKRIIHLEDLDAEPDSEIVIEGFEPVAYGPDLLIIPQPGHTKGHCMLLFEEHFLFTGDVLTADEEGKLAQGKYCWYSWKIQQESLQRLSAFRFSTTLPSHGRSVVASYDQMAEQLKAIY